MSAEEPTDPTGETSPATDLSQEPGSSDASTTDTSPAEAATDTDVTPDASEPPGAAQSEATPDTANDPETSADAEPAAVEAESEAPAETEPTAEPDAEPTAVEAESEAPAETEPTAEPDASEPVPEAAEPTDAANDRDPREADASEPSADAEPTSASEAADPASALDGDPVDHGEDPDGVLDPEDPLVAMLAELDAPRRPAPAGVQLSEELPIDPEDDLRGVEGEASLRLVSILESLLFAAARPLKVQDLRRILAETSKHQIQLALAHLMAITRDRGVVLAQVAGGFQFRTHPENAVWVQKMLQSKPTRLSRTQIETLAIVAYRQPITRPEIDDVRGVDSGAVLKGLLERELVQIVGRKEEPGRPLLYGTTVKFLEFFNLRGLRDLPTLRDFRDLSEESKATLRTQLGASEAEALGQGVLGFPSAATEETDMQQPTFDEMPSGSDPNASPESDFTAGDPVGAEQEPTPREIPGDPAPDELVPPAPERLPQPGPDEIRPPDPGTDSPGRPDEWHSPGPDIADVPGVDPGSEPSEV